MVQQWFPVSTLPERGDSTSFAQISFMFGSDQRHLSSVNLLLHCQL